MTTDSIAIWRLRLAPTGFALIWQRCRRRLNRDKWHCISCVQSGFSPCSCRSRDRYIWITCAWRWPMKTRSKRLLSCLLLSATAAASAQDFLDRPHYAQLWIGNQSVDQAWSLTDSDGADYLANLDKVRRLGFSFQAPYGKKTVEYGWDVSGSLGYEKGPKL